jgi:tRNA (guanosine-2'-O-)-methyltransferase
MVDPRPAPAPKSHGPIKEAADALRAHLQAHCPLATALLAELTPRRATRILEVAVCRLSSVTVVMENLVDTHNAAAVLRTAEGLGLDALHVVEEPNRWERHKAVARSADNWIAVHKHQSVVGCLAALRTGGARVYAADVGVGCTPVGEVPIDTPVALIFGSEHAGLSKSAVALADGRFTIPMHGFVESFNVSVSAAVALWELTRRRRAALQTTGAVGDLEMAALEERARRHARKAMKDQTLAGRLETTLGPR